MLGELLLAARLLLDAPLASEMVGGEWLVRICKRESGCPVGLFGVHRGDGWMQRSLGAGWSTRGHHGHVARYAWPYVPSWLQWWGPAVLDWPLVSAWVSVRRAESPACRRHPACRSWLGVG